MRGKLFLLRSALAAGTFSLTILLAEGAMRVLDLGSPPWPDMRGKVNKRSADPDLLIELRPDGVLQIDYRSSRGAAPRTVEMRVNERGMRGPTRLPKKRPQGLRIACIGDSFTFGWGVDEGQSWPDHLQKLLDESGQRPPVEVLNFGVPAYTTAQEVACLQRKALAYDPDVVLLAYFVNDISIPRPEGETVSVRDPLQHWTHPRAGGAIGWLRSRSLLADSLCDGVFRRRSLELLGWHKELDYREGSPGWTGVQSALVKARDLLEERGIRFGVLLYPFLKRRGEFLSTHDIYAIVRRFCVDEHIPCLDTESAFLAADVDALRVSAHDYHPCGEAHAMFAAAVRDWLVERRWLSRKRR